MLHLSELLKYVDVITYSETGRQAGLEGRIESYSRGESHAYNEADERDLAAGDGRHGAGASGVGRLRV